MTLSAETHADICRDYNAGYTLEQCAKRNNTSSHTVRGILIAHGVPRRLPGPAMAASQDKEILRLRDSVGLAWKQIALRLEIRPNEATRRYNAAKVRELLPDKIKCTACGGTGKIPNPKKRHDVEDG